MSKQNFKRNVDTKEKLINYDRWNGVLLFWGFKACKHKAVVITSRSNGVPLGHCVGEITTIQKVYFKLKVVIAVLCGSSLNSLTSNEGVHLDKINLFDPLLPSSQKQLVWAVVIYFPRPFLLTTVKGVIL